MTAWGDDRTSSGSCTRAEAAWWGTGGVAGNCAISGFLAAKWYAETLNLQRNGLYPDRLLQLLMYCEVGSGSERGSAVWATMCDKEFVVKAADH